jgi:nicotinate-nucleotide pyrophosphorylase (carboxylating)
VSTILSPNNAALFVGETKPFGGLCGPASDLRDEIFKTVLNRSVTGVILADDGGIIAGTREAAEQAKSLGLVVEAMAEEGQVVREGDVIVRISGSPKQIALAEDFLLGFIAKPSGIATATRQCVDRAGGQIRIVCGAWKKIPAALKESMRKAVVIGGGHVRIAEEPFVYLDKNYIRMLGGIESSLQAVGHLEGYIRVVQVRGSTADVAAESCEAALLGADIVYVDTGRADDLQRVGRALERNGLRERVRIAFGGNVRAADLDRLKTMSVDIVDIGRHIVDAPLMDLRLEVVAVR